MTGTLIVEQHRSTVTATIRNDGRMNSLDSVLRRELTEFWNEFRDKDEWKVCVLSGYGDKAFCTGRDLKETAEAFEEDRRLEFELSREMGYPHLHRIGKPVIAAVSGHCVGGGLAVALGCPIRVCSENAKFGAPQVARGRGTELPLRMKRLGVPQAVILDMTLSGDSINAHRAHEIGLVSRIYPDKDTMMSAAIELGERLAANGHRVVRGIISGWETGILDLPLNDALPMWNQVTGGMMTGDEETRRRTFEFVDRKSATSK